MSGCRSACRRTVAPRRGCWRRCAPADGRASCTAARATTTRNTISAKEAEKLGCRKIEGAPMTSIQTRQAAARGRAVPGRGRPSGRPVPAVDPVDAARARQRRAAHPGGRAEQRRERLAGDAEGVQQRRARASRQRAELPEVPRPRRRHDAPSIARKQIDIAAHSARAGQKLRRRRPVNAPAAPATPRARRRPPRYAALDLLATHGRGGHARGRVRLRQLFVRERARHVASEHVARAVVRLVRRPQALRETVAAVSSNAFSTSRLERAQAPALSHGEPCRCT